MNTNYIKTFGELEQYTQESGPNIVYKHLLPKGVAGNNISMGLVTLEGPTETEINSHFDWMQAYVILSGSGTVILGNEEIHISEPSIVNIPLNTQHGVRLSACEKMQYIYVNNYSCK